MGAKLCREFDAEKGMTAMDENGSVGAGSRPASVDTSRLVPSLTSSDG